MEENYNKVLGKDNVIVSNGAKQAISAVLTTIINPLDEVIIVAPYWVSYPEMVKMVYAKPVIVTPGDGRFQPELDDVTDMVSSYTKAIIINSPNNPSGAVYSADFIGGLVEFCEKKGIYLIMDDIYHKLVKDRRRHRSSGIAQCPYPSWRFRFTVQGETRLDRRGARGPAQWSEA
jgi:aspartate aminotransferase